MFQFCSFWSVFKVLREIYTSKQILCVFFYKIIYIEHGGKYIYLCNIATQSCLCIRVAYEAWTRAGGERIRKNNVVHETALFSLFVWVRVEAKRVRGNRASHREAITRYDEAINKIPPNPRRICPHTQMHSNRWEPVRLNEGRVFACARGENWNINTGW